MKMKQKLVAGAIALSAMAGFSVPAAHAEVSASVGVANMYYWRGMDLGGGAALSADINYSASGFTVGMWTSSGDEGLGTEYDLYVGYGGEVGDFNYGLSVVSYNYPNAATAIAPGDYVEAVATLGYGPFAVTYYDAIAADVAPLNDKDYNYITASLTFDKFSILYGVHENDSSHVDLTYTYNDNLSFTLGVVVDDGDFATYVTDEPTFVVNLSLPIDFK